jgi:hypothetical protein
MILGIEGFKKTVLLMTNLNFQQMQVILFLIIVHLYVTVIYFSIEIPYAKIHGTSFVKFRETEVTP